MGVIKTIVGKECAIIPKYEGENRLRISALRDEALHKTRPELFSRLALSFERRLEKVVELQGGLTT